MPFVIFCSARVNVTIVCRCCSICSEKVSVSHQTSNFVIFWLQTIELVVESVAHFLSQAPVVYATDRSKAVVPVLFLFRVALWSILRGASCCKVFPCSLSSCFFSPFIIVITLLGEEGAGLCASRAFVCYFCTC